jgi:5'-nucleotidase/UDP-sugar diphosphatase
MLYEIYTFMFQYYLKMKRILSAFILISIFISISGQEEKKIVILHTNDLHSRLNGFSPESAYSPLITGNDKTTGGFSRIAAILKTEKNASPGITLTIDAGDFIEGTLFHALEVKTGFQLRLMKKMGYDLVCLGNHEFDLGPGKLAEIISQSSEGGEIPAILLGNAVFNEKDAGDNALEELYQANTVSRKLIIDRDGLKIGIFSLLGKDAVDVSPLAKPVKFSKQFSFARKMVKELQKEKCDIIICVSHSGVSKDENGRWGGEDVELAESVKGIDLIISGHTHTKLSKPIIINGIPIVQTGEYGQNVGRLDLTWSDGKLRIDDYSLIPVDDNVKGDGDIEKMIEEQQNLVTEEILSPLGIKYFDPVAETDFALECNEQGDFKSSNLGPMVADAIHNYVNKHSRAGCDISLVAVGVIRDRFIPGIISAPDVFRIMSLGSGSDEVPGYPLARLYFTGKELKNILEILQVAYKSSPSNFCFYSGLRVEYDPAKRLLKKIKKIDIIRQPADGTIKKVDFSKNNQTLYSLTANSYMLEFIGIIKKMSFGLINVVPKDASGNPVTDMKNAVIDVNEGLQGIQEGKEWLALLELLSSMKDTDNDGIPDIDKKYSVPVQTFFPVK